MRLPAWRSRKMRGFEMMEEEFVKLVLIIIIGLVVVIIIMGASGGIAGMINDFCMKNPSICGSTATQADANTAKASFDALVVAQNCVLNPAACTCVQQACVKTPDINSQSSLPGITSKIIVDGISGFQLKPAQSKDISVQCTTSTYTQTEMRTDIVSSCDECKCTQANCKKADCSSSPTNPYTGFPDVSGTVYSICTLTFEKKGALDCTIKNFNLPDNFVGVAGAKKEYIEGTGDPNFLVYYQNFPVGEDELWSGFGTHYEAIGTGMFVAMCAADFIRPPVKKLVGSTVVKPVSTVLTKAKSLVPKSIYTVERKLPEGMATDISWYLKDNRVSMFTATKDWALTQMDKLPQSVKTSIHTGLYAGIDTEIAYLNGYLDSKVGKFEYSNPQSLVLQVPFIKGEGTRLADNKVTDSDTGITAGMPIVLNKGSTEVNKPFYLASPCHADLAVKSSNAACASYSYSSTGEMECDIIQPVGGTSLPNCMLMDSDSSFIGPDLEIYNAIKGLLKSKNTKLFEFSGNNLQKAYLPLLGNPNIYLSDFQQTSSTIPSEAKYSATLYVNGAATAANLEMTCININQATPTTISAIVSGSLAGKLTASAEEGSDLCYFDSSMKQTIRNSVKLSQVSFDVFFIKYQDYFYEEILSPNTQKTEIISLRGDSNGDRYSITWDMTTWTGPDIPIRPESGYFFTFENSNSDGTIDHIQSFNCKMPSVEVSASAAGYTDKYNFCYTKGSQWTGAALTTMSFALDAYVKRNPLTFVAGAALDCGLAFWELERKTSWPNGGIK